MRHHPRTIVLAPLVRFAICLALPALLPPSTQLSAQSTKARTEPAQPEKRSAASSIFRNTDPSVPYVGSKTCAQSGCHADIDLNYQPSPHGQSMTLANIPSDLARIPAPVTVFNRKNNHYYIPTLH